jgi:hypothetical protein
MDLNLGCGGIIGTPKYCRTAAKGTLRGEIGSGCKVGTANPTMDTELCSQKLPIDLVHKGPKRYQQTMYLVRQYFCL